MAISLVIDKNPWTPQPVIVNGDVLIMPHLGAVTIGSGSSITGNIQVCEDLPNKSSVVLGNNVTIGGAIIGTNCTQGGGVEA